MDILSVLSLYSLFSLYPFKYRDLNLKPHSEFSTYRRSYCSVPVYIYYLTMNNDIITGLFIICTLNPITIYVICNMFTKHKAGINLFYQLPVGFFTVTIRICIAYGRFFVTFGSTAAKRILNEFEFSAWGFLVYLSLR